MSAQAFRLAMAASDAPAVALRNPLGRAETMSRASFESRLRAETIVA